jgi:transcriptional regulator with XRE-family HTH domain
VQSLARSKEYRAEFVVAHAKHSVPLQIQELLEQQELTQTELARRADVTQGTVSRAADPSYGNLTLNTLVRLAAGFDVALICAFVPFSRFIKWIDDTAGDIRIPKFAQEYAESGEQHQRATAQDSTGQKYVPGEATATSDQKPVGAVTNRREKRRMLKMDHKNTSDNVAAVGGPK